MRENRISSDEWPPIQGETMSRIPNLILFFFLEPPTRKRTSMTIFVQRPCK